MQMLNGVAVVITTVERGENYLDDTLASFFVSHPVCADRPISLVVGSPQTNYLMRYQSHPSVEVIEMGPALWEWIKNNSVRHRATWNYYRCLTCQGRGKRGSLILEDDVNFALGWCKRLDRTITALERLYNSGFVLSLYDPWGYGCETSRLYVEYERENFFGTQGMYFPAETQDGFARYLKAHGVVANEGHYDHLLRDYALEEGLLIFASTPSLVQHMGTKTTGLGSWHYAPNFVEDVSVLPLDLDDEGTGSFVPTAT